MSDENFTAELFDDLLTAARKSSELRAIFRLGFDDLPKWAHTFGGVPASGLREVARALDVEPGARVLDLACGLGGPGLIASEAAGISIVGIDWALAGVTTGRDTARDRGLRAGYAVASADAIPLRDSDDHRHPGV